MGNRCCSIAKKPVEQIKKSSDNHSVDTKISKNHIYDDIIIDENKSSPIKSYKYIKKLGSGGFSNVYLVEHKMTNNYRAMKKLLKNNEEKVPQEVNVLKNVSHPNIVKVHEYYYYIDNILILSEYCGFGDLSSLRIDKLEEKQVAFIFFQILYSVFYLHSHSIIHRDLKDKNILVSEVDKNGNHYIKLIDFGLAKLELGNKKDFAGTPHFVAPEILKKEEYNEKCDMWSCGVILYYLVVGELPFEGLNKNEINKSIINGKFSKSRKRWINASEGSKSLIKELLKLDAKERISAADALKNDWFKELGVKEIIKGIDECIIKKNLKNLIGFKCVNKLQHAILSFMFHNMETNDESKSAEKVFILMDEKYKGKISKEKFKKYVKKYLLDEDVNLDEIFSELDSNESGYLEFEEFLVGCMDREIFINETLLKYTFSHIDKTHSGKISVKNLVQFFHLKNQVDYINDIDKLYILHGFSNEQDLTFENFKSIVKI